MRNPILFSIILLFLFSCNKNKYTTVPQLKYKSVNTKALHRGETLRITLSFTDAEGDLTDTIFIREVVKPCPVAPSGGFIDSTHTIPSFPSGRNQSGEIIITYDYSSLNPLCNRNDTAVFKFVLRDKAKHKSDTAVSEPIVIYN
ncbi:MAG: hypothetical protein JWO92_1575 [Chitinophagaceae bacterium]|nr:hypothetical protein [Chitinophagaceae bacterium]MDB5224261.1 hypothetical protein [Chitinophagaceae bacterium]